MKRIFACVLCMFLFLCIAVGCSNRTNDATTVSVTEMSVVSDPNAKSIESKLEDSGDPQQDDTTTSKVFDADTPILEVINNPEFEGYGQFLFPTEREMPDSDMKLSDIALLFPLHDDYINVDASVDVLNTMSGMAESGELFFYDIYTDEEKEEDPSKENAGIFFFRGEPDAPFAVASAEGAFLYVASIHASFPYAVQLSQRGYNAFALQYRTGGLEVACEDLAAAISFIFENADELQVNTNCYSLWGGSAGGQMVARISSHGTAEFGGDSLPGAGAIIMQYTSYQDYTGNEPPTYGCIGEDDTMADPDAMERRINNLRSAGIDTEFHVYPDLEHGFGLGYGTPAEGWFNDAVTFWERQMDR